MNDQHCILSYFHVDLHVVNMYSLVCCIVVNIPLMLRILKSLGSGEFGNVSKAVWTVSGTTKEVAVKTLKPGSSENDKVRFLQEAAIMGQFNHPYVVKLYGVVTVGDPVSVVVVKFPCMIYFILM